MPQKKLQKNRRHSISILRHMKKILLNFQWNPPSKMRKPYDQTLKTSFCEILFWALRRVSVAIVTNFGTGKWYVNRSQMAQHRFAILSTHTSIWFACVYRASCQFPLEGLLASTIFARSRPIQLPCLWSWRMLWVESRYNYMRRWKHLQSHFTPTLTLIYTRQVFESTWQLYREVAIFSYRHIHFFNNFCIFLEEGQVTFLATLTWNYNQKISKRVCENQF